MAVQAFVLGQIGSSPVSSLIVTALINHTITEDITRLRLVFDIFTDAYHRGKEASLFFAHRVESYLSMPIDEVREKMGIRAATVDYKYDGITENLAAVS